STSSRNRIEKLAWNSRSSARWRGTGAAVVDGASSVISASVPHGVEQWRQGRGLAKRQRDRVRRLVNEHAEAVRVAIGPGAHGGGQRGAGAVGHLQHGGARRQRSEAGGGGGIVPGGGRDGRHQHRRAVEGARQAITPPGAGGNAPALGIVQTTAQLFR